MYEGLQSQRSCGPLRIPLLYGVDSVHGMNNVIGAVVFPQNIGLGCTRNAKLVDRLARITAAETRATGINWAFSPCVTAPQDIRWGRTYEGFSEDASVVAPLGAAATRGLQQVNLANAAAVAACVKHFAGDGGTTFGTGMPKQAERPSVPARSRRHPRPGRRSVQTAHLRTYIPSIEAGAAAIMPSYSSWNGEKASGSKHLLTAHPEEETWALTVS